MNPQSERRFSIIPFFKAAAFLEDCPTNIVSLLRVWYKLALQAREQS